MSKSKVAYYRKIYIAYLIDTEQHNLVSLEAKTCMHKRTLQTAMAGFPDIGIAYEFMQTPGAKNGQGVYRITDWGDHSKQWIKENMQNVIDVLQ
ncbi:hypothetical protein A3715_34440 [Oleiphilus sp. HI0009]|nr:hypothetical protein A3715_15575 [Oleiphilus sp. HI0009]KZX81946.1 hypothetical protein A3715_34440 [Oleiphilus sp. HI0009]